MYEKIAPVQDEIHEINMKIEEYQFAVDEDR